MSHALQRIDETRDALIGALAERNWDAIGELDMGCRACIDEVLSEAPVDEVRCARAGEACWWSTNSCWR